MKFFILRLRGWYPSASTVKVNIAVVLGQRPSAGVVSALSRLLTTAKIEHAVSGAAAAAQLAPFVTSVPVAEVWATELKAWTT